MYLSVSYFRNSNGTYQITVRTRKAFFAKKNVILIWPTKYTPDLRIAKLMFKLPVTGFYDSIRTITRKNKINKNKKTIIKKVSMEIMSITALKACINRVITKHSRQNT